jgi:hypothetical protein
LRGFYALRMAITTLFGPWRLAASPESVYLCAASIRVERLLDMRFQPNPRGSFGQGEAFTGATSAISATAASWLVVYEHEGHHFVKPDHQRERIRRTVAWFDAHLH